MNNEENETAKGTNLKIGNDMKLSNFIEKEIKEEKSSPEVVEYKISNQNLKQQCVLRRYITI